MFLWCNSNSLQIIELHADAWSWRRLIADRQAWTCCNSAAHVKLGHCAMTGQDIRLLPTVSTPSLSSYFIFSGVSAYFIGFSAEVGRNVFSKWLEIETEHQSLPISTSILKFSVAHLSPVMSECCEYSAVRCTEVPSARLVVCLCRSWASPPVCFTPPNTEYVYF